MNVQPLSTVKIPTIVNPNLKAKTPTSEHPRSGLRIPTTPTASTNTYTKLPTPTGTRIIKSGSGIASSSKGNSRVAPVSPNKSKSTVTGRKSATTPSRTPSSITSVDKSKKTFLKTNYHLKKLQSY
jgi:hypothetical protein